MTAKELITDYCSMLDILIKNGKAYYAFGLICTGIEFLGKCLDDNQHDFFKGKPRDDFKRGFEMYFKTYVKANNEINIYENLRHGLMHSLLPKEPIWLNENNDFIYKHLDIREIKGAKRLVINIREFLSDFKNACNDVQRKIDTELKSPKVRKDILVITT